MSKIELWGKLVSEGLAIQGKSDALAEEISQVQSQVIEVQREIDKLTPLIRVRDTAQAKLDKLGAEFAKINEQLEASRSALKEENISLPLAPQVVNRRSGV